MATDPQLPGLCRATASRVNAISADIIGLVSTFTSMAPPKWKDKGSRKHDADVEAVIYHLRTAALRTGELEQALRHSASVADQRLQDEAEARRRADMTSR